jgi:hypothetical protein
MQYVTEDKKGLRNELLHDLWRATNNIQVIRRMGGACGNKGVEEKFGESFAA